MHPLVLVLTSHNLQVRFQLQFSDVAQAIILHQIVYSAVTWFFEVSSCFLVRRDVFSLFPVCHNSVQVFSAYLFGSSGHLTLFHFLLHWSGLRSLSGVFLVVTIPDLCVWWWQRFLCLLLFISEETGSYCWSDQLEHMWEASLVWFSENTFDCCCRWPEVCQMCQTANDSWKQGNIWSQQSISCLSSASQRDKYGQKELLPFYCHAEGLSWWCRVHCTRFEN